MNQGAALESSSTLSRQGHRLLQVGVALFLFTSLGGFAIVAAYLTAAIWGAGNTTMPLAAGAAHGTAFQELAIKAVGYSSAPTGIIAFVLILWGLRVGRAAR